MANTKSAQKAMRQAERRALRNRAARSSVRTYVKNAVEAVATTAKAVESDLARELADTNRMSVASARVVRDRLAAALRALAEALVSQEERVE